MGKGIRIHYLNNPAFGLLPILLYCILVCFINIDIAIYISLLTNCIFYFANRLFYRKNLLLFVSKIVFLLLLSSLGLFFIEETFIKAFVYVPVFIELLLAIIIIRIFYFKKIKSVRLIYNSHLKIYHQNARQRTFEFIYLINVIFFSLLIYLFIISCLFLTGIVSFNDFSDVRIVNILRVCLLTAIIIYTQIKMVFVNYKFSKEDWLPIINDDVRVIGKIAKSVSYKFKEKYLHPRIRVFVFYNGMIYLKPREKRRMFDVNKYDTPFQEDIFFNESFEDALKRISILTGLKNVKPKFICKYLYEHINIRRMMFVYIINLNDELNLKLRFPKAKLWTEAQIKDNIGKDCFGNCFEQEFELLESVVFPALKIMNDDQKDDNNIGTDSIG